MLWLWIILGIFNESESDVLYGGGLGSALCRKVSFQVHAHQLNMFTLQRLFDIQVAQRQSRECALATRPR